MAQTNGISGFAAHKSGAKNNKALVKKHLIKDAF
jgi:hypothetical protein